MSEMRHTKGPWRHGVGHTVVSDHANGIEINGALVPEYYGGNMIAESVSPNNAHLIAAAPDLLEALEAALFKMEDDEVTIDGEWGGCRSLATMEAQDDLSSEIVQARTAIAKAKGESQ